MTDSSEREYKEMKKSTRILRCLGRWFILLALTAGVILVCKPAYHVNDDWIIRDIFSGRYSGTPDAHVYSVIYPFACLFVGAYKLFPQVDWWGGYLCISVLVCFYLLIRRALEMKTGKLISALLVLVSFLTVSLYPALVFTFTTTGSMLCATGVFLLFTDRENGSLKRKILPLILLVLSFCTRKDTFYMAVPFIGLWFAYHLLREKKQFIRQGILFVTVLACMAGVLYGWHSHAFHSDSGWNDYLEFRSLRITVHDYTGYPKYKSNKAFYDELGLSEEEYDLVRPGQVNTAFDISPGIRTVLKAVSEYQTEAKARNGNNEGFISQLWKYVKSIWEYHSWKMVAVALVFIFGITILLLNKQWWQLFLLAAAFLCIFTELGYLAYRGRFTRAVGNALVMMGLWVLAAILISGFHEKTGAEYGKALKVKQMACLFAICVPMAVFSCLSIGEVAGRLENRWKVSARRNAIDAYCVQNSENHYFEPSFSISYAGYNLTSMNNRFNNLVTLGGWNYSSPVYEETMHAFGLGSSSEIEEAILTGKNFYIISNKSLMDSVIHYYEWKYGDDFHYEIVDTVASFANVYSFDLR